MIETGPWAAGHRGPSLAGRLAAVVLVWAAAAAVVLGTAAFTRIGPVVYVIDARHGVHAFDALVAVAAFVVAVPSTVAFLWRSRQVPAPRAWSAGADVPQGWAAGPLVPRDAGRPAPGGRYGPDRHLPSGPSGGRPLLSGPSGGRPLLSGPSGGRPLLSGPSGGRPLLSGPSGGRPLLSGPSGQTVAFAPAIRRPRLPGPDAPTVAFVPAGLAG